MDRCFTKIETYDKSFWNNLEKLRHVLLIFSGKNKLEVNNCSSSLISGNKEAISDLCKPGPTNNDALYSKVQLLEKIRKIFKEFVSSEEGKKTLAVPDRKTWKNTNFEKDCGIQLVKNPVLKTIGKSGAASTKRLIMLQHLLTKIYKLIETDSYKTKRELYYEDVALFKSQSVADELLDDIACLLNVSKTQLHVLTTSKGCIAGTLRFKDAEGNYIDCSETARGKGFPDVNTREILRKLFDALQIPILGVFDADPYGIEILGTYKYGSKAMAFDVKNLAVPEMRWLGLLPTDIRRLRLPAEATMPLSENDKKKANQLLNLPYIQHHQLWLNEVQVMLKMEKKAEIEGLSKISPMFLPSIYLPNKIKYGGWI